MGEVCTILFKIVVHLLGLQVSQSSKFQFMVGNSDKLQCNSSCSNDLVIVGNTQFFIDFYVLLISGVDVVLADCSKL